MAEILILAASLVFGLVCAFYVSVVGFTLSALVTFGVLIVLDRIGGSAYGAWTVVGAFVAMQVGYFLNIVGSALMIRISRANARDPKDVQAKSHFDHE